MREKTCYCGCIITKLNKDEFTLDKCNNEECSFNHSKFDEYIKELKNKGKKRNSTGEHISVVCYVLLLCGGFVGLF